MLVCGILAMIDRVGAPFLELPLKGYERLEREALDDYNSVRLSRSNSEARDTLREKVLPKWRKARASLESNGWLLFDRARVDNLRRYMDLREEGFLLLLEAVERGDKELADRANAKQNQAEALLGELQQRK
jgi:hypothetical protein